VSARGPAIRRAVGQHLTRAHFARRAGDAAGLGVFLGSARSHRSTYTRLVNALYVRNRVRLALEDAKARQHRRKSRRSSIAVTGAAAAFLVLLDLLRRRREPPA